MTCRILAMTSMLIILAFVSISAAELDISGQEIEERIDALISEWDRTDAPGMAVLVQNGGVDIYSKCVGLSDLELGVAIGPETCFDFASASKHLTAFGIMLLVGEGKLSLDDPVRKYLPELPPCAEPVLVRHLLHQSSGLWEFFTILNKYSGFHRRDYIRMQDVLTLLAGQPALNFEPGSRFAYTNTNYSLLSIIVERAGGKPFGEWMEENVFGPLGMESTVFQTDCTELIPHRATAYLKDGDGYLLARPSNVEIPGSAHAFTNIRDMSRWLANFRDTQLGGEQVFELLTTPGVLNNGSRMRYAAGLNVGVRYGRKTISHSGQTGGYKTMIIYCPAMELGIVVLANVKSISAVNIAYEILDICLNIEKKQEAAASSGSGTDEAAEPFATTTELLNRYAGGYRLKESGQLIGVYGDREWLVAAIRGLGGDFFSAKSETEFSDYYGNALITFELNSAGEVEGLSLAMGGEIQQAQRLTVEQDPAAIVQEAGGAYFCEQLGSLCEIGENDSSLVLKHRRYGTIDLYRIDTNDFFCEWGFIGLERNKSGAVTGFKLTDELFGWQELRFVRVVPGE